MTRDEFREWRQRLDLSQVDAALKLGMGRRQVQKYEAGEAPIPHVVELACEALERRLTPQS